MSESKELKEDRNQVVCQNERAWLQAQIIAAIDWGSAPAEADIFFARKYRGNVEAFWQKTGSREAGPLRQIAPAPSFGLEAFLSNWTGFNYCDGSDPILNDNPAELCQVSVPRDAKPPAVLSDEEMGKKIRSLPR